jgi:hypothetical protein
VVLKVFNSSFISNRVDGYGGALFMSVNSSSELQSTDFKLNKVQSTTRAWLSGGAVSISSFSSLKATNCTFEQNGANDSLGGAATLFPSTYSNFSRCLFVGNIGVAGGGIYGLSSAVIDIDNSAFKDNLAMGGGAALFVGDASTLRISNSLFLENDAAGPFGSALHVQGTSRVSIFRTIFENNFCESDGGAASFGAECVVEIKNSNFLSNIATSGGGAIVISCSRANLTNCIFKNNRSPADGGALMLSGSHVEIKNSFFLSNTAAVGGVFSVTPPSPPVGIYHPTVERWNHKHCGNSLLSQRCQVLWRRWRHSRRCGVHHRVGVR